MTKNQIHEWRDRLTEYEEKRTFRGYWDSREWQISVLDPDTGEWIRLAAPSADTWLSLRRILWNKYLRNRIAHKMVARVNTILEGMGYTLEDLNRIAGHGQKLAAGAEQDDDESEDSEDDGEEEGP